jgi:ribosome maturation factor RimP
MSPSPDRARLQATRERIAEELSGPLAALGLDVEAVELTPAGSRRVLRVAVDQDGGVRDSDLVDASRVASEVLDGSDVMGKSPYTLEVTSPGVDRPLTLPRHWRRNADRLVRVTLTEGEVLTGRIGASTDEAVTLDVEGEAREVAYADVTRAVVQIEFNRRREEES